MFIRYYNLFIESILKYRLQIIPDESYITHNTIFFKYETYRLIYLDSNILMVNKFDIVSKQNLHTYTNFIADQLPIDR